MDMFLDKSVKPMLIGSDAEAFDSPDYLYELKLDGERCIAYLDPVTGTHLRNKRDEKMLPKVPELKNLHKQVKARCILDGELTVIKDGKPDFAEIQRRSLMNNSFKIELASQQAPASFIAFDILYYEDSPVTEQPLTERKKLLGSVLLEESPFLAESRYIEQNGVAFYNLAKQQNLEGIVAKRKDSKYAMGKRTKDWIKMKHLQDDDFVVCGYIQKQEHITSLVLAQYDREGRLQYKGHVTTGVGGEVFARIQATSHVGGPLLEYPRGHGNEEAVWIEPLNVCTVRYMYKTASGGLRQPVLKGLREDKSPEECVEADSFSVSGVPESEEEKTSPNI